MKASKLFCLTAWIDTCPVTGNYHSLGTILFHMSDGDHFVSYVSAGRHKRKQKPINKWKRAYAQMQAAYSPTNKNNHSAWSQHGTYSTDRSLLLFAAGERQRENT